MLKKVCSFNDDWFNDPRFSKWIARDKSSVKARCTICGCSFNLSNMGIGAVISHSTGKKHISKTVVVTSTLSFYPQAQASTDTTRKEAAESLYDIKKRKIALNRG